MFRIFISGVQKELLPKHVLHNKVQYHILNTLNTCVDNFGKNNLKFSQINVIFMGKTLTDVIQYLIEIIVLNKPLGGKMWCDDEHHFCTM